MNIMSKGIATETILYLLVGIVVVGILVFLVYRYLISGGLSQEDCRGIAITWCTGCKNSDPTWTFSTTNPGPGQPTNFAANCAKYFPGITSTSKCSNVENWCSAFIPV
jgi:hypothetical protein